MAHLLVTIKNGTKTDQMKEVSSQVRETEDGYNAFNLLDKAKELKRLEMLRQCYDGNNRYKTTCLLEAQININRAWEALTDSQQPL